MLNTPLCTVCIPNYNGESYIAKCIDSVVNQEGFLGEIEILVHDDASTDHSVEVIRALFPQVCREESNLRVDPAQTEQLVQRVTAILTVGASARPLLMRERLSTRLGWDGLADAYARLLQGLAEEKLV